MIFFIVTYKYKVTDFMKFLGHHSENKIAFKSKLIITFNVWFY